MARNFSPARNVLSITAPSETRLSFVRTKAPPLPGLTCWNSTTRKIVPSTSMWLPFLNWLVEIVTTALRARSVTPGRLAACNRAFVPSLAGVTPSRRGTRRSARAAVSESPDPGTRTHVNRKEAWMVALIVLLLILALFGGLGFALHFLWILLIIALVLWVIGFFISGAEATVGRRRWYGRW